MKLGDFFDSRYVTTKKKVFKKCVEKLNSYKKNSHTCVARSQK